MEKFPTDFSKENPKEKEEKDWKSKSNENLKKRGSHLRIININYLLLITIILGIVGLVFIYSVSSGYFKPILVDNSSCTNSCPVIPACPNCNLTCGITNITASLIIPNTLNLNVVNVNFTNHS